MVEVYEISAVTLKIKDMERSCNFYSKIPGLRLIYGGGAADSFTTYEIGDGISKMCLNLELSYSNKSNHDNNGHDTRNFGRIIFHTNDVNKLYSHFKTDETIFGIISIENEPTDAPWGERYFHIREPDGYQLSFAQPIKN